MSMCSFLGQLLCIFQQTNGVSTPHVVVLCFLFGFCASNQSLASNITSKVTVFEKDGVYYITASAEIAASVQHVHNVITDYVHIYRLSDSIIESRIISPKDSNNVHVETLVQCCIPMFCKDVLRVEEVSEPESGLIQTKIIPEKSDFKSGTAEWKVEARGGSTHLSYESSLEPDFFIPPIVGTKLVINNMRDEFSTTIFRIGRIASINESREWDNNLRYTREPEQKNIEPCALLSSADSPC